MRKQFVIGSIVVPVLIAGIAIFWPPILWTLIVVVPLLLLGVYDMNQRSHSITRNFPVLGHARYMLELIRPEIYQYFIESNSEGVPFPREVRSVVYQRSKKQLATLPFGTQMDLYEVGYEWVNHSLAPTHLRMDQMRVTIGGPDCKHPYSASLLNISAMSFGALSNRAVRALNKGAKLGNFAHNTGEGGVSPYHLENGGDLIWQIGTGYFGCRNHDGSFNLDKFTERANIDSVKMIEIKLSQGAKPGHGGILPAAKLTPELAQIRDVPLGKDVLSPPAHSAFSCPMSMMDFIAKLREASGGKPVGFKLCVGKRREFFAICKAMLKSGIAPDFIAVDGGEGGTGAAPLEFSNHIGCPLSEGLIFVHNALVGYGLRSKVRVMASGRITTAFDIVKRMAVGADVCYSARGMMMALGCIQAVQCNTNHCPVGITTQNPWLVAGLDVEDKAKRVYNYHHNTLETVAEMIGAMGLDKPSDLRPWHLMRRTGPYEIKHYGELYDYLRPGDLLKDELPASYERACRAASPDTFAHVSDVSPQKATV